MKTIGKIWLNPAKDCWGVTLPPPVMLRFKALFPKVGKKQFGTVSIKNTPETCRDLEWFLARYSVECPDLTALQSNSEQHQRTLLDLEEIQGLNYRPRAFKLSMPARDYQAVAAETHLKKKSLLLADHLGLGKSVTALATLTAAGTLPALIVAPAHIQHQWGKYIEKFLPAARWHLIKKGTLYDTPPAEIYVTTYHKLHGWAERLGKSIQSIIFDEVHELRHADSLKYAAAHYLRGCATWCMGLSATPIFNYGGEIYNVMEIISPGEIGSREEFEREWCSSFGNHIILREPEAFGSYLREQFIMMRRTRQEVGRELPPVQTIVETVDHTRKVMKDLEGMATELARRILSADTRFTEKGEAAREFDQKLRMATGIAKAPFVAAFVRMLLEEGEQVILTGWHRNVYDVWAEHLKDYPLVYYTGTESPAEKDRSVAAFLKKEARVLILSLRSGAGLDGLQEGCNTLVHGELDWSPQVHHQILGRLNRDGQTKPVTEYFLLAESGSDPSIAETLGLKKAQFSGLVDQGKSLLKAELNDGARVKKLAEDFLKRRRQRDA